MPNPGRSTQSACSFGVNGDSCSYSFRNDQLLCMESRLVPYYLKRPRPEWEIIPCRKQERELIRNYEYMLNCLQRGAEIYRRHLEMKAKSQQWMGTCLQFLGTSISMYRNGWYGIYFRYSLSWIFSLHDIIWMYSICIVNLMSSHS